jgi:hypothetical protein
MKRMRNDEEGGSRSDKAVKKRKWDWWWSASDGTEQPVLRQA